MPQGDKSAYTEKQKRQAGASEKGHEQKGVVRPEAKVRGWGNVTKLQGGSKKFGRGKVPSGPVGGSGRKTNLARSS